MACKVGDRLHWVLGITSGEGLFIGHLKRHAGAIVVAVGAQLVEMDVDSCSPLRDGEPSLGERFRRAYLKRYPGSLK